MSINEHLDPERQTAARVAARAQIYDIRTPKIASELFHQFSGDGNLRFDLAVEIEFSYEDGDDSFIVSVEYAVEIDEPAAGPNDKTSENDRKIARISFTQAALFDLAMRDGDEPITEDEMNAYASTTGQFALYPYARELISTLTGRMGLPPLTIPVFSLKTNGPASEEK